MTKNTIERGKSKQYYFFKSLSYLKPYKFYMFISVLSCVLFASITVTFPIYTEKTLTAFTSGNWQALLLNAGLLLVCQIASSIVHMVFWGTTADRLRAKITRDIRYDTVESILNLKTQNFDLNGSGRLIQVISTDTASLSGIYTSIVDVFTNLLAKIAIYVYIFAANYILGFYCIFEFVVICLVYQFRIKSRMKDQEKYKNEVDKNIGFVNETIRGSRDIKNYNINKTMLKKTSESLQAVEVTDRKFGQKQYQLWRVTVIVRNILSFLFIPLSILLIHYNLTTFETAFTIFVFRTDATSVIDWIMSTWDYVKDGGFYAERIFDIICGYKEGFEEFPEKDKFEKLPKQLNIEIKNLSFAYNEKNYILKNLDLTIPHGSKIAIVGGSGSGKSTILKLLNKTYDVERGKIFIGNQDVCDFSKNTLRDLITIVSQEPYIFNFSILENLAIINPHASKKQIESACKKAQIHNFIKSLPEGYNTKLGEGGTRLSGGQKQRLAIARAFLKDSPILIFDETTSALDNENQSRIKDAINSIGRNKTVIIVAHRLSTIEDTDIIHFLKDGKILTSGTHLQLLEKCDEYKQLYEHENSGQVEIEKFEESKD